jgi:hypothetical protein
MRAMKKHITARDSKGRLTRADTRKIVKAAAAKLGKREVWRVPVGDKVKTLTTSSSSTSAMDEAVEIYSGALERLANR